MVLYLSLVDLDIFLPDATQYVVSWDQLLIEFLLQRSAT